MIIEASGSIHQDGSGVSLKKNKFSLLHQVMKSKRKSESKKSKAESSLEISAAMSQFKGRVEKLAPGKALYAKTEGDSCAAAFGSSSAGRAIVEHNYFWEVKRRNGLMEKPNGKNSKRRRIKKPI